MQASWPHSTSWPLRRRMRRRLLDVTSNPGGLVHCGNRFLMHWEGVTFKRLPSLFSLLLGQEPCHSVDSSEVLESGNWCSCRSADAAVQSWLLHCPWEILRKTNPQTHCKTLGTLSLQRLFRTRLLLPFCSYFFIPSSVSIAR